MIKKNPKTTKHPTPPTKTKHPPPPLPNPDVP